ncbi:MAG: ParB/RepB/Spo0J family partition protein [Planctomycetes bacterium]|nr:ParB/RepB/Spo0J family partition protein [Planctomycetota bacterium]
MPKKPKRPHLGKGLEALLGPMTAMPKTSEQTAVPLNAPNARPGNDPGQLVEMIPVRSIQPNPYQPRTTWNAEDLADLAESIRINGVIQPIIVRQVGLHYQVIAGERRLRASKQADKEKIPALIRKANDKEMLELALVENIHRANLNPIERALAYQNFISTFSLTQSDAAKRLGENRSVVANHLRLLDLPKEVKTMLIESQLSMGHARAILSLPTDDLRRKLANRALAGRLSVRSVERLVKLQLNPKPEKTKQKEKSPHIVDLEYRLQQALSTKVRIDTNRTGQRGRIVIDFYSLDEFDKLTEQMGLKKSEEY